VVYAPIDSRHGDNRAGLTRGLRLDSPACQTNRGVRAVAMLDLSQTSKRARRRFDGSAVATPQVQEQDPRLFLSVRGITKQLRGDLGPLLPS